MIATINGGLGGRKAETVYVVVIVVHLLVFDVDNTLKTSNCFIIQITHLYFSYYALRGIDRLIVRSLFFVS